ncbi:uncharacterized protein M6D78_012074 [Vipera latastei]
MVGNIHQRQFVPTPTLHYRTCPLRTSLILSCDVDYCCDYVTWSGYASDAGAQRQAGRALEIEPPSRRGSWNRLARLAVKQAGAEAHEISERQPRQDEAERREKATHKGAALRAPGSLCGSQRAEFTRGQRQLSAGARLAGKGSGIALPPPPPPPPGGGAALATDS